MRAAVPAVEVPDDRNGPGVGGPDAETRPGHTVEDHGMGAQFFVQFEMAAFFEKIDVVVREHGFHYSMCRRTLQSNLAVFTRQCHSRMLLSGIQSMSIQFVIPRNSGRLFSGWMLIITGTKPGTFCNCSSMAGSMWNLIPTPVF